MEERVCSRCGVSKPLTEEFFRKRKQGKKVSLRGVCKECMCKVEREANKTEHSKEYRKNYYHENIDAILDNKAVYYQNNKEKIHYTRCVLNREKFLASKRKYNSNPVNKAKNLAYAKEYRTRPYVIEREKQRRIDESDKNKEYQKEYLKTDRGRTLARAKVAKRRSLRVKSIATFTPEQMVEAKEFFDYECPYCGIKPDKFDEEHIIPLSKGGAYTRQNIVPACEFCNGSKNKQRPRNMVS